MEKNGCIVVAIDGPAGSGKSTVAKMVAKRLNFSFIETGAIYRSIAFLCKKEGIRINNKKEVLEIVDNLNLEFRWEGDENRKILNGEDVTDKLYSPEISELASKVSAIPEVREALIDLQRGFKNRCKNGIILEGRDIQTVIFPDADFKFFLTASPEERARRRYKELKAKGFQMSFEEILEDVKARDLRDQTRKVAPLKPAEDAVIINSDNLTAEEVASKIVNIIKGGKE